MMLEFEASGVLMTILTMLVTVFVLRHWVDSWGRKFPPGPLGLPLVGYIPFLTMKPYLKLMELKKKYGPIYSVYFGGQLVVMLCDYPSIKDAFSRDALMGRPKTSAFQLSKETIETGAVNNVAWKEQRKFSLHALRDLGFGKSQMEGHIKEEIQELLEILEKEGESPIVMSKLLSPSMSNNIASLMFGHRRKYDDPRRIMLDNTFKKVGLLIGKASMFNFFPVIGAIISFLGIGPIAELKPIFTEFKTYVKEEIRHHQETVDPNNVRDYIDRYILEVEKRRNDPKSSFQIPVLQDLVGMFFGAGSETIRITIDWMLLVSAANPSIQQRVQREIDTVIGPERFPSRSDAQQMPFTEAVLLEILRWRASFPINLPRYTLEDVQLGPYHIPKGSYVVAVLWAVHHDPEIWGSDVDEFKPERFLSEDGKEIRKPEQFLPFSIGKRACPGEPLAYVEVFLYYTAILQKFHLKLPDGATPDMDGVLGLGLQSKPYQLCLRLRQ